MYGEHRLLAWSVSPLGEGKYYARVTEKDPSRRAGYGPSRPSEAEAHRDAIALADAIADLRDGIDLRAQLAAVTAERDKAIADRNEAFDACYAARAVRYAVTAERDAARAALAAAGIRARVGRVVLGAIDRLRWGGE